MRVLLINSNDFTFSQLPKAVENQRGLNPPISLAYLAAAIREEHVVQILDMDVEKLSEEAFIERLRAFKPNVIGFSVMISNIVNIKQKISAIKSFKPGISIVL